MVTLKSARILLTAVLAAASTSAYASTMFSFTSESCSTGCAVLPAGTVTLTQNGTNIVNVTVQLTSDYSFKSSGNNHSALVFDVSGITSALTASSLASPFSFSGPGTFKEPNFGDFQYAILDNDPTNNQQTIRTLSFTLTATGLKESSFVSNGTAYFAADVTGTSAAAGIGQTGNVGALAPLASPTSVPEPSSIALLGTGLLGIAGTIRRRLAGK